MDETLLRALNEIRDAAPNGRISCKKALCILRKTGLDPRRIRSLLDREGMKVIECQLGCFGWQKTGSAPE